MTNEITAEEAIRWLDAIKKYYIHGGDEAYDKKRMKAVDKAIQALEQQPCEDCISREAVEEITFQEPSYTDPYNILTEVREKVRALPPVKPQYTDEEIDKAQAVEQAYVDKMVELAVEGTERPKGKWIKCKSRFGTEYFKCSECGRKLNWIDSDDNYCNSCGSDNSESTKELYKEKLAEISGGGEDEVNN